MKWMKPSTKPDEYCPSVSKDGVLRCSFCGDRLYFGSKAALERHQMLCHQSQAVKRKADFVTCTFENCGKAYKNQYQLNKRKKDEGHTLKRGRQRKF